MRKYLASLAFVGFSWAASPLFGSSSATAAPNADAATPVAVQQVRAPVPTVRDEIAMVLVGSALIGLAAAVRRAA
jgi:hypothetical protein